MRHIKLSLMMLATVNMMSISKPAIAQQQQQPIPRSQQSSFISQFQDIFNGLQTYINGYQKQFVKTIGKLEAELNGAIQSSIGDLGVPDPLTAGRNIERIIEKLPSELLSIDPRVQAKDAVRDWNQQYTRGQSQSVLGNEGQRVQAQEANITNDAVMQSYVQAEAAQQDVITQDILKKMSIQTLQTASITKGIHAESQKQSRSLAAANINLADISGRLDEEAKLKSLERRGVAREVIRSAAMNNAFWENQ